MEPTHWLDLKCSEFNHSLTLCACQSEQLLSGSRATTLTPNVGIHSGQQSLQVALSRQRKCSLKCTCHRVISPKQLPKGTALKLKHQVCQNQPLIVTSLEKTELTLATQETNEFSCFCQCLRRSQRIKLLEANLAAPAALEATYTVWSFFLGLEAK